MENSKDRIENLNRLFEINLSKSNINYLHYSSFYKELKRVIALHGSGKILDIGCGNKPYEKEFKNIIEYIGCDIIQSSMKKVDVLCRANNIPFPDNSFDTVFSTQTIEHVEDHQGLVDEAYRLLKPGGHFIVSGPMYWHLHEEPYDFFRFTKFGFKYILEKGHFTVVELNANGGMWATTGQALIHSFMYSTSKNFLIRMCRFLFYKLHMCWLINSFFSTLDRIDYNTVNTMNYVVVGKKV